ncbi:MAG: hypothetical protein HY519_03125 [Candidatus Aenigmarchaeota archaeon]|nr:hypothetical protein [Candidatus Aenigmarchaeota archaeon]
MINLFRKREPDKAIMVAAAIAFTALAFIIYTMFFDILIPGLPDGSYRQAVGALFAIPAFLLAGGQTLIAGFFLHALTHLYKGRQPAYYKAAFITAVMTLMFSFTYVIFPNFGPFYYIVFAVGGPDYALPVEIFWTLFTIGVGTYLTRRIYGIAYPQAALSIALVLLGITVAAS